MNEIIHIAMPMAILIVLFIQYRRHRQPGALYIAGMVTAWLIESTVDAVFVWWTEGFTWNITGWLNWYVLAGILSATIVKKWREK